MLNKTTQKRNAVLLALPRVAPVANVLMLSDPVIEIQLGVPLLSVALRKGTSTGLDALGALPA